MASVPVWMHIGLAKTATTTFQRGIFSRHAQINYLGKNWIADERAMSALSRWVRVPDAKFDLQETKGIFSRLVDNRDSNARVTLVSEEDFTTFRFIDPSIPAIRAKQIFPDAQILLVLRNPIEWLQSMYYFRLSLRFPETLDGFDQWVRNGLARSMIGTDIGQLRVGEVARFYVNLFGTARVKVMYYEDFRADPIHFIERICRLFDIDTTEAVQLYGNGDFGNISKLRISSQRAIFLRNFKLVIDGRYKDYIDAVAPLLDKLGKRPRDRALAILSNPASSDATDANLSFLAFSRYLDQAARGFLAEGNRANADLDVELVEHVTRIMEPGLRYIAQELDPGAQKYLDSLLERSRRGINDVPASSPVGGSDGTSSYINESMAGHPGTRAARWNASAHAPSPLTKGTSVAKRSFKISGPVRRTNTAESLMGQGLLKPDEVERFCSVRQLPPEFSKRVLERWGSAVAVASTNGVTAWNAIPEESVPPIDPPMLMYDGPMPRQFLRVRPRAPAAVIYDALEGKLFVGLEKTTLVLDEHHYFSGVSCAASPWIAPAFASTPTEVALDGTVAVLFADGATLFSHWMFDLLPKLEALGRAGWTPDKIDYFLVNTFRHAYQRESLQALGIAEKKVIMCTGGTVSADRLLIPSKTRSGWWTPNWVREFIKSTFLPQDAVDSNANQSGRRLYISRAKSGRRRILNEDAVGDLLHNEGFETLFAEDLTVAEVAQLVRGADEVVAPHGAGLANIVFAQPHVRVLETYGAHIAAEGWLMTSAAGGHHHLLAGKDQDGRYAWHEGAYEGLSRNQRNQADYFVDIHELSRALRAMRTLQLT